MKKLSILFFCSFFVATFLHAQEGGTIHNLGAGLMITGVSPNGIYATGYVNGTGSIIWTKDAGVTFIDNESSQANCISNNGVIAGRFYDWSLPYRFIDWEGEEVPLLSGGYYKDGAWHSLGIDPDMPEEDVVEDSGSNAEGISADGTIIGGSWDGGAWVLRPVIWTNGAPEVLEFNSSAPQGAKIRSLSGNGAIACGWESNQNFSWECAIWVNGVKKVFSPGGEGQGWDQAWHVSSNGKYAAMVYNGKPTLYDIELDEMTVLEVNGSAVAVSDNGVLVGYTSPAFMDRRAFIFTKEMGMVPFADYLVSIGISEAAGIEFETPMSISANGRVIGGFGWLAGAWIVEIEEENTVHELAKSPTFSILPNPATNNITIAANSTFRTVEVIGFLGQTMLSQSNTENIATLDISHLTNGVYFVRIITDLGISVQKFVKQ
jgi:uncharacterized membrane protein